VEFWRCCLRVHQFDIVGFIHLTSSLSLAHSRATLSPTKCKINGEDVYCCVELAKMKMSDDLNMMVESCEKFTGTVVV